MKKFYILGILSLLFSCSEALNLDDKKAPLKWKDNATIYELNVRQFSEIGDIQWLTIDECSQKIRKEQSTKLTVIQQVDEFSKRWNHDFNLKE